MAKKLLHGDESRQAMLRGVDALANAVKVTLGPRGRNVVIEKPIGPPTITKDGVTVAKEIILEDPLENMGAALVKEVASKTADMAGDGTTTATLLAQAIYAHGINLLSDGCNPMDLKRGIDIAVSVVTEELAKLSTVVPREVEAIAAVGTISANGEESVGQIIAEAMMKVGVDGLVSLGESADEHTFLEFVDGMSFDRGYISPYFINDLTRNTCVLEGPAILVTEHKLSLMTTIQNLLGAAANANVPLLVIADDVEGEALGMQAINVREGRIKMCSVRAPSYGQNRRDMLEDIAILTGATFFSEDSAKKIVNATLSDLGAAERVVVTQTSTTLVNGKGWSEGITQRLHSIRMRLDESQDDAEKDRLKHRIAKLAGGVAVVKVGAATETEMKEKKARVEDAIHATRAAMEEGIVPGGGVALLRCQAAVSKLCGMAYRPGIKEGIQIIVDVLDEPMRTILENAGIEDPDAVIKEVTSTMNPNAGYDALHDRYVDMIAEKIIDPAKVTRLAIQNAASVAGLMLTTEALVSEIRTPATVRLGGER